MGLYGMVNRALGVVALPAYTHFFLNSNVGWEYGVGLREKLLLMRKVRRNATRLTSATGWLEQLTLVAHILALPKSLKGEVVECGCYKGASTSSLSLACEMTGRRLIVCDSFEGLPEVAENDRLHVSLQLRRYETYKKGEFKGGLEEVKENVSRFGAIGVCEFVKGYFEDTLGGLDGRCALIFLDVDLHKFAQDVPQAPVAAAGGVRGAVHARGATARLRGAVLRPGVVAHGARGGPAGADRGRVRAADRDSGAGVGWGTW